MLFGPWLLPALHAQEEEGAERMALGFYDRRIAAYPYAYYTPETELAIGAGGIVTYYTAPPDGDLRPSKTKISGYYSTRGQYEFCQDTELYFRQIAYLVQFPFSFGSFVDKYWGQGNRTEDNPVVDYDVRQVEVGITVDGLTPLMGLTRDGFVYRGLWRDITDPKENPYLTEETLGVEGGYSSGFGFDLVFDTRDHIFSPTTGGYSRLYFLWYAPIFGSDYRYNQIEIDLRRYLPLGGGNHVVGLHLYGDAVYGDAPFYSVPAMGGGNIMRGYYYGRYRDVNLVATQVEYRSPRWWRFSTVLFAGVGEVFGGPESNASFSQLKTSLGGGLRFLFDKDQGINLRVDLGFGRGSNGLYFGLEEAF